MKFSKYIFLLCIIFLMSSCFKFEGDQTVPTYLEVNNSFKLVDNPELEEGSLSCSIVDAKIVIDENVIGIFELPCTAPVLFEGNNHNIRLWAGVKMNGIANSRIQYPFYNPILINNVVDLVPGQTIKIPDSLLVTSYIDNCVFAFMENFENVGLKFEEPMEKTSDVVFEGQKSGYVHMYRTADSVVDFFNIKSTESFTPPNGECFLEMNFKCDHEVEIGLQAIGIGDIYVITLNPTGVWKKIYINLSPKIAYYYSEAKKGFKLVLKGELQEGRNDAKFYFDNFKVVHYK